MATRVRRARGEGVVAQASVDDVLAAAAAAKAAQPAELLPSKWERRALLSDKCGDGMRRKQYFKFHPGAEYATAMDVAAWLARLDEVEQGTP
jgi:hypothetical protein